MSGPQNGIIGEDFGTTLPEARIDQDTLSVEKNMAKFSKSKEYKKLKEHLLDRVEYYQSFLPDGRDVRTGTIPTAEQWVIANAVIGEFKAVLTAYENAQEVVENANR